MSLKAQPLSTAHDILEFACENDLLDTWLKHQALRDHNAGQALVTVWTEEDSPAVVAYHAITVAIIESRGLNRAASRGYAHTPGWLIGRLAVATGLQGRGLGGVVLQNALEQCVARADLAGGRIVIIDPIDERAAAWYRKIGFASLKGDARIPPRMYLRIADIRNTLQI